VKLSWLLTPSSVMLIIDCGSPLTVDARLLVAVLTPGRNVTAFSAFRDTVGMRFSWSAFSVEVTVAVWVLINSELLVTLTCSGQRAEFKLDGQVGRAADDDLDLVETAVLKPCRVTVTLKTPAEMPGMLNAPSEFVTAVNVTPASPVTVTEHRVGRRRSNR
jgi:hypothetical protein